MSWVALVFTFGVAVSARAEYENTGCSAEGPLIVVEGLLEPVAQGEQGGILYRSEEWRLPVSPQRPDVLTEARLNIEMNWTDHSDEAGDLRWSFTFNDPKPFGLPFSFQAMAFIPLWAEEQRQGRTPFPAEGGNVILEDWSSECSDPGVSMFPGGSRIGSHRTQIPRPPNGTDGVPNSLRFRLVLWGSRS
jgi:hypothetical protein